jgi:DNA-binding response OmpR family regulator
MEREEKKLGRILVVDDEESVARLLRDWLSSEGYEVRCANGFDQAREEMEAGEFDLVTLDIMMPDVDGLGVLRWLSERYPDVGVIMATALGQLDSVLEAMRGGAINYLLKPFNMDLVTEEIKRGMERQRLIAENRAYQRELEQKVKERTAQLQRRVCELDGLDRLVHFQMGVHSLEEAHAEVLEVLQQVLDVQRAIIYRVDEEAGALKGVAAMGLSAPGRLEGEEEVAGIGVLAIGDRAAMEIRALEERKLQQEEGKVAVPILFRDELLGMLVVEGTTEWEGDEMGNCLWRLSGEAALVLQGAMMAEGLDSDNLGLNELENLE